MKSSEGRQLPTFGQLETSMVVVTARAPASAYYGALSGFAKTIKTMPSGLVDYRIEQGSDGQWQLAGSPTSKVLGMACDKAFLQAEATEKTPTQMTDSFARRAGMIAMAGFAVGMKANDLFTLGEKPPGNRVGYLNERAAKSDDEVLSRYAANVKRYCANKNSNVDFNVAKQVEKFFDVHEPYLAKMPREGQVKEDDKKAWDAVEKRQGEDYVYSKDAYKESANSAKQLVANLIKINTQDSSHHDEVDGFAKNYESMKEDIKKLTTHGKDFKVKAGVTCKLEFDERPAAEKKLIEKELAVLDKIKDKLVAIDEKRGTTGLFSDERTQREKQKAVKGLAKEYYKIRAERAKQFDPPTGNILQRQGFVTTGFKVPDAALASDSMDSSADFSVSGEYSAATRRGTMTAEASPIKPEPTERLSRIPEEAPAIKAEPPKASPSESAPARPIHARTEAAAPPTPSVPESKPAEPTSRRGAEDRFKNLDHTTGTGASHGVGTLRRMHEERIQAKASTPSPPPPHKLSK